MAVVLHPYPDAGFALALGPRHLRLRRVLSTPRMGSLPGEGWGLVRAGWASRGLPYRRRGRPGRALLVVEEAYPVRGYGGTLPLHELVRVLLDRIALRLRLPRV